MAMNAVIPADLFISAENIKKILLQQFSLEAQSLKLLGEGWDNAVYLVNEELVFRFPRRKIAVALIEREMRVLPKLKKFLSLAVPEPIYLGKPSHEFQAPFYAHPLIEGVSGCRVLLTPEQYRATARTLAAFLKYLHNLDLETLDLDKKDCEPEYNRLNLDLLWANLCERYEQIESKYNLNKFRNMIDALYHNASKYEGKKVLPCLVHNDLYHRHLIFNNNILTAVIDWGDCCVGDPVVDLGIVYQFLPQDVHDDFYSVYGTVKPVNKNYAQFLGLYSAIALLWFGDNRNDKDLVRTSLWTLHELQQSRL